MNNIKKVEKQNGTTCKTDDCNNVLLINEMGVEYGSNNLLMGHSFENLEHWHKTGCNCENMNIRSYPYEMYTNFGKSLLRMQSFEEDCAESGVCQTTDILPAGQYAFSAYVRVLCAFIGINNPGAYIRVATTDGTVLAESTHVTKFNSEYLRLVAPFMLDSAQRVQVQILLNGKSFVYVDAVQLENSPHANAYNMLENGSFEHGTDRWETSDPRVHVVSDDCFKMGHVLMMTGNCNKDGMACQTVQVKTNFFTRETFTLSGWAKGCGYKHGDTAMALFRLRAVIKYYDTYFQEYGEEEYAADFDPCTEGWQFTSIQFAKSKYRTVGNVKVYCEYGNNTGTVYFGNIQLIRNSLEAHLSSEDFMSKKSMNQRE